MTNVTITLNSCEALVLFEWLATFDERDDGTRRDEAARAVAWSIEGQLESVLVEIVLDDYKERVEMAKAAVLEMQAAGPGPRHTQGDLGQGGPV